jgi:predicted ATPase
LAGRQQFLQRLGVVEWPDGTLAARYSFVHALYQQWWHEQVTPLQLQRLHREIGARKEQAYGQRAGDIAAELALHFEQGREYGKAIQYQGTAAQSALLRNAPQEALSHLNAGMQLLETLPETSTRYAQEVQLQMLMGLAWLTTKGYSAPETEAAYARAYELCQRLDETPQLCPILLGLALFSLMRCRVHAAQALAEQCLRMAERVRDSVLLSAVHQLLGSIVFPQGELLRARRHLERALAVYDPHQHQAYMRLYGHDPGVFGSFYLAGVLCLMGYPEQAAAKAEDALALARQLGSPYILHAALNLTITVRESCRETATLPVVLRENQRLAREHGYNARDTITSLQQAQLDIYEGRLEQGIQLMGKSLATWQAAGGALPVPYYLGVLAEVYGNAGQVEEGLTVLAEALALDQTGGIRFNEAGLYRLKGELILQRARQQTPGNGHHVHGADLRSLLSVAHGEAEACFLEAIDIARRQQAKMWELRATVSLARLRQSQGKMAEAHKILAEIYQWFTEGFDTVDLKEAKALLDSLGSSV